MNNNYLVFHDGMNALMTMKTLVNEGYVTMLSKEDNLWIVNYLEVRSADRNDVVFMEKDEFEEQFSEIHDEVDTIEDEDVVFDPLLIVENGKSEVVEVVGSCPNDNAGDHNCSDCFYKFFAGFEEPCDDCKRSNGFEDNWAPFRKCCANCEYDELDSGMYPCCECSYYSYKLHEEKWELYPCEQYNHNIEYGTIDMWQPKH